MRMLRWQVDGDALLGVAVVLLGLGVLVVVSDYPDLPGGRVGPALFPRILAVACVVFGGSLLVRRNHAASGATVAEPEGGLPSGVEFAPVRQALPNALIVVGAIALYVTVSERIGFAPTAFVLSAALMLRLGVKPLRSLITSAVLTVAIQFTFAELLGVPLPATF